MLLWNVKTVNFVWDSGSYSIYITQYRLRVCRVERCNYSGESQSSLLREASLCTLQDGHTKQLLSIVVLHTLLCCEELGESFRACLERQQQ